MQVNFTPHQLSPGSGYIQSTIPKNFREAISKEIEEIQETKQNSYANGLVGVINDEYSMPDLTSDPEFLEYLYGLTQAYNTHFDDITERSLDFSGEVVPRKTFWVNYQKKGEYNPIHHHSGLYSFVIWIKIPYDLQEEKNLFKNNPAPENICVFQFVYHTDRILTHALQIDKSYEWEIVLFPSWRSHSVAPFLTSDKSRISIAGNLTTDTARDIV